MIDLFPFLGRMPEGVKIWVVPYNDSNALKIPLFESVKAGFPSPAEDYLDACLDLNDLVIKHPAATFFVKVDGDSMIDVGIESGDVLVVDRALDPINTSIVVAIIDGDFTVKRIHKDKGQLFLVAENIGFDPIVITEEMDFQIWGVVTFVVHSLR